MAEGVSAFHILDYSSTFNKVASIRHFSLLGVWTIPALVLGGSWTYHFKKSNLRTLANTDYWRVSINKEW